MARKFEIECTVWATLELEDEVIDCVDDEWRKDLYNLQTPEEIAQMIGRNMIRGAELSDLDGWANQPNSNAKLVFNDDETVATEAEYFPITRRVKSAIKRR